MDAAASWFANALLVSLARCFRAGESAARGVCWAVMVLPESCLALPGLCGASRGLGNAELGFRGCEVLPLVTEEVERASSLAARAVLLELGC